MTMMMMPVAVGELIDKLTILEIKIAHIKDPEKLKNIQLEHQELEKIKLKYGFDTDAIETLQAQLKTINQELWTIEDDIRDCEFNNQFDQTFIDLARAVYITNDKRCEIKRQINLETGSQMVPCATTLFDNYKSKKQLY